MFYVKMTDDEIAELDPITNQYPFLTCASREISDLLTVYVLLSRNPSLLEKYIEQISISKVEWMISCVSMESINSIFERNSSTWYFLHPGHSSL